MFLLLRARKSDKLSWAIGFSLLAGFSLGYAFNTRPWTAFAWSLPFLALMARDALRFSKYAVARGAMLTAGFAVLFLVTLHCNTVVTGNPMQFPYSYFDSSERLGFGVYDHTLLLGFRNLVVSLTRLNTILFGFPISLVFVFLFIFSKKKFGDRLSFGILASVSAAYLLFYTPGVSDLGPVYYYELLIPLLLLSARGLLFLHEKCSAYTDRGKRFIPAFLLVSCLAALGTTIPERISHVARLTNQIREPYTIVQSAGVHHALVMIQPYNHPGWVFGYRNPSPKFTDDIVYCQYADSVSNHDVVHYFHDRVPYTLKYDSIASHFVVLPVDKETGEPLLFHSPL
jgi:4-amino-4-deoxy-L-arabinose transferase-like glycosyltransferase